MSFYLDTSVLVTAFVTEAATSRVQGWLAAHGKDELAVSWWVTTELSSALATKLRIKAISLENRAAALAAYSGLLASSLVILDIAEPQFATAARFADQHALGLRSGDALHLAICARHGATLCTLDQRQAAAGPALGVGTQLL